MSRFSRLVLSATTLASIAVLLLVLLPTGATGAERSVFHPTSDTYVFGKAAEIDTPVSGSLQSYGGSVVVREVIAGDLLSVGGKVQFEGRGKVEGNLIYAGSAIAGADGRVGGKIYPLASLEGAAASMASNAVVASLLIVWFLAAVAVALMSGREIRLSSVEVRASALHCFVLGLVALTSFVLTAIAFSYLVPYVVGIPLLAALGVFAILTKVYGMIAVFHAVGTLVAGTRDRRQLETRKWFRGDLAMVVLGVLILGAVRMIPVVGTFAWAIASVFGVGVALGTRFGRRDPWFLEFRSAAA